MRAQFKNIGLVRSRADTIRCVAAAVVRGDLSFDVAQEPAEFCKALCTIKGIGDWTAQYVVMRALKHPDAWPATDLGLLKAIQYPERMKPGDLVARAEAWRPWRAYAAMLLWNSLGNSGG
jgi:AraC family transcriptional regulator of adaptative response / DNA-3-methyladenine glycosylase II